MDLSPFALRLFSRLAISPSEMKGDDSRRSALPFSTVFRFLPSPPCRLLFLPSCPVLSDAELALFFLLIRFFSDRRFSCVLCCKAGRSWTFSPFPSSNMKTVAGPYGVHLKVLPWASRSISSQERMKAATIFEFPSIPSRNALRFRRPLEKRVLFRFRCQGEVAAQLPFLFSLSLLLTPHCL